MHRLLRCARGLPVLLMLWTLGACGAAFQQPEVEVDSVQLGGLGLRGGTLLVNLAVVNPNRFALDADQLQYSLVLGDSESVGDTTWIDFVSGTFDEGFSVPARDSSVVQIPVEFSYSALGSAAASILRSGTFDYQARGAVDLDTPLGTYAVPFQKRGTVTLMGVQ